MLCMSDRSNERTFDRGVVLVRIEHDEGTGELQVKSPESQHAGNSQRTISFARSSHAIHHRIADQASSRSVVRIAYM